MLGTRAPSPALSAKREQHCGLSSRDLACYARCAGEGARAPSYNRLVSNADRLFRQSQKKATTSVDSGTIYERFTRGALMPRRHGKLKEALIK